MRKLVLIITILLASQVTSEPMQSFKELDPNDQNLIFKGMADTFELYHQMNNLEKLEQIFCLPDEFDLEAIHTRAAYSLISPAFEGDATAEMTEVSLMVMTGLSVMFKCEE